MPLSTAQPGWKELCALAIATLCLTSRAMAQEAGAFAPPAQKTVPAVQTQEPPPQPPPSPGRSSDAEPVAQFDQAIFLQPIPADQLTGFSQSNGTPARDLLRDKRFKKLLHDIVPNCMFHYGRDMPLDDALDMVMSGSKVPVRVREGRYLVVSGLGGPYLAGRGFVWIDLQEGIGLGGFYFHPTNGEPTPSLVIYSRQVKEKQMSMRELPPAFALDLVQWAYESRVPTLATRYFITGSNKRILLEHDEDYCSPVDGSVPGPGDACMQMNADAADLDETAAYYLDQVNYATNATAWMIGPDQVAWIGVRDRTCGGVIDPLGCRIRVTREHTHVIIRRGGGGGVHVGRR